MAHTDIELRLHGNEVLIRFLTPDIIEIEEGVLTPCVVLSKSDALRLAGQIADLCDFDGE